MNTSLTPIKKSEVWVSPTGKIEKRPGALVRQILLICGILAALHYTAINLIVPQFFPGYSSFSQTVSELSAIGAPTRQLWNELCIAFTVLITAFGCGVWLSAGRSRPLLIAGGLLMAYGLVGIFWPPMHLRETLAAGGKTLTDTLHILFTTVTSLLMMAAMAFGAQALGKWFRFYSALTIVVLLGFGGLTSMHAAHLEANEPTPWMGVWERVNIYATMLWLLVLAVLLLRREKKLNSLEEFPLS